MSLISLKDVSYRYSATDKFLALEKVSLDIEKGEWIALIGANGSGKSTLVKTLNGLNMPQEGSVKVDGLELNEENIWTIRQKVGMVFRSEEHTFELQSRGHL